MGHIERQADFSAYDCRSHSLRLGGNVTSIRLENAYWETLGSLAATRSISVNKLIAELCQGMVEARGCKANVASLLRVTCLLFLRDRASDVETTQAPGADASRPFIAPGRDELYGPSLTASDRQRVAASSPQRGETVHRAVSPNRS